MNEPDELRDDAETGLIDWPSVVAVVLAATTEIRHAFSRPPAK